MPLTHVFLCNGYDSSYKSLFAQFKQSAQFKEMQMCKYRFWTIQEIQKKIFLKQSWDFMITGAALCTYFGAEHVYTP